MKHNWEHKRLKDVCYPKSSIGRASSIYSKDDIIEYIDISSINKDINEIAFNTPYCFGDAPSRAQQCVKYFDVVVSLVRPNLKNIAIVKDDRDNLVASSGFCVLRGKTILPKLIFYIVNSQNFTDALIAKCAGAAYPAVKDDDVKNSIIPVPPMAVQEQIVAELDKINEVIADCRELLRNLDALAQSLFYDTFGDIYLNPKNWKISTLGDVSEKISNGANTKIDLDTYKSEGIMFFRCQNVWRNHFDLSDVVYVNEETNSKMKGSVLKHNDLLVTKIGRLFTENSSLGRVALYEGEDGKANLSGNLSFIRLRPTVVPKFILYILISDYFRDYVRNTTSGGIDKRALNNSQLKALPIYIPPLAIQNQFAAQVERIEEQKKAVEITIAELQTLLDSRMDYWFN